MKVLLVNGSPHKKGCTYTALTEVQKTLNEEGIETEIFLIKNKPIGGCIACLKCSEIGKCVFDDVVHEFAEKMKEADSFIFGTPVHYARTTATYDQLNKHFGINQMPIISSRYWNMVHGYTPEDVKNDEEGMQIMRIL